MEYKPGAKWHQGENQRHDDDDDDEFTELDVDDGGANVKAACSRAALMRGEVRRLPAPKVRLAATHIRTLDIVPLSILRQYAVDLPPDEGSAGGSAGGSAD